MSSLGGDIFFNNNNVIMYLTFNLFSAFSINMVKCAFPKEHVDQFHL